MVRKFFEGFLESGDKGWLFPCRDNRHQNTVRSSLFHVRKKYPPHVQDLVGISNAEKGELLFVKLYRRDQQVFYKMEDNGELVPLELHQEGTEEFFSEEVQRIRSLMEKDGCSAEEIKEVLDGLKSQRGISPPSPTEQ